MATPRFGLGVLLGLGIVAGFGALVPAPARAQMFSPGALAKPHAGLEGLRNCLKCHDAGQRLSNDLCLTCHAPIARSIERQQGFHGRSEVRIEPCAKCHHEHQGKEHELIEWPGGKSNFNHASTGFPLRGQHQPLACSACHEARRQDAEARKHPDTFMGLEPRCAACHFDEHRGQEKAPCERCHEEKAWKPPPGFNHNRTAFRLEGQHQRVACGKCHPTENDDNTPGDAFPAPKDRSFLRLSHVPHRSCTNCHDDPHDGKLGQTCTNCHSPVGWQVVSGQAQNRAFHDKTRYPLKGGHTNVACEACHGPFGNRPAQFKGLPFEHCNDCHVDAHLGQITGSPCERCHAVEGFTPAHFGVADHADTRYPLEGAHLAVPCDRCHTDAARRIEHPPPAIDKAIRERKLDAADVLSPARFDFANYRLGSCNSCHGDPHRGQFGLKACTGCHSFSSFYKLRFDHGSDSRFPLTGKHTEVPCAGCHRPGSVNGKTVPVYKPLETACAACHDDVHAGQFKVGGGTACETCHTPDGFKPSGFDLERHAQTRFPLEGKHAAVACTRCHTEVRVAQKGQPNQSVRRFRGMPTDCAACHADFHGGTYRGEVLTRSLRGVLPQAELEALPKDRSPCTLCHNPAGWRQVAFAAHDRTAFPLRGAHAQAPCADCHAQGFERMQVHACVSCHRDPHGGELGQQCAGCHDDRSFRASFDVQAHRRTNFPLVGRHALIPCQECHGAAAAGFSRAPTPCYGCHADDYLAAATRSIDHESAGFGTNCQTCHDPWDFRVARFPQHEQCFSIGRGPHRGIACDDCHAPLSTTTITGACATGTAACSSCHEHTCQQMNQEHRQVQGYECKNSKCYTCHQFSGD